MTIASLRPHKFKFQFFVSFSSFCFFPFSFTHVFVLALHVLHLRLQLLLLLFLLRVLFRLSPCQLLLRVLAYVSFHFLCLLALVFHLLFLHLLLFLLFVPFQLLLLRIILDSANIQNSGKVRGGKGVHMKPNHSSSNYLQRLFPSPHI